MKIIIQYITIFFITLFSTISFIEVKRVVKCDKEIIISKLTFDKSSTIYWKDCRDKNINNMNILSKIIYFNFL